MRISQNVVRGLKEISVGRTVEFDDADIQWYLHDTKRRGPAWEKLRADYDAAINRSMESAKGGVVSLTLFSFSADEAKKLLEERKFRLFRQKK